MNDEMKEMKDEEKDDDEDNDNEKIMKMKK